MSAPRKPLQTGIFCLLGCLVFVGCTLPAEAAPTLDRSANFTQAAGTLQAQLTQIASGALPTVTPLGTQSGTTIPVLLPTASPALPPTGTPDPDIPCDRGTFLEDVSIPDGTAFKPGEIFVKTWKIRNDGSCTWTPDYTVIFDSGDAMGGPASFAISNGGIPPGSEVEISVQLTAPQGSGNYRGDWKLRNAAGQPFGLGSAADATFWVIIAVSP